jgi:hypothetical protein
MFDSKEIHQYDSETGAYIKSFPSQNVAEKELHMYRGAIADILKRKITRPGMKLFSKVKYDVYPEFTPSNFVTSTPAAKIPAGTTITEQQLREKHDMFFQIMTYVQRIPCGRFIEEGQMLRELAIAGKPHYKDCLGRPELKNFRGKVDGTVYYGPEDSIKKLKGEGVLQ